MPCSMKSQFVILLWLWLGLAPRAALHADCTASNLNLTPLPDLGIGLYKGFIGGLYSNGGNRRPPAHEADGRNLAVNQIAPRLLSGNIDTNSGKIVVISIGMSNTTQEWASKGNGNFKQRADADPAKNPQVVIVDGAQGGQDSVAWTNRNAPTWTNVLTRLAAAGVNSNQVQVAWVKTARAGPNNVGAFPVHALSLQADMERIVRNLKSWFPNIQIAFISSRTRSYQTNAASLNPEPFAYESGFATKWLIEKQIAGAASLNYASNRGPVVAPFLSWGPYLWADGLAPRSDGFTWACNDLETDFTHPNTNGVTKVADQLLAFFKTDALTVPWFLRKPTNGLTAIDASASASFGFMPWSATFSNGASAVRHWWTFGDGTFSTNARPAKSFFSPGPYPAQLTVTDASGNWQTGRVEVVTLMTYDSWAQKKFTAAELGNPSIADRAADPDGDGIVNDLEFRLALEPKTSNRDDPRRPLAQLIRGFIEYSFSQAAFVSDGFMLQPQITDDVQVFDEPTPRFHAKGGPLLELELIGWDDEGMTDRLSYRSSQPLSVVPTQFIRLRKLLGP